MARRRHADGVTYVQQARAALRRAYPTAAQDQVKESLYLLLVLVKGQDVTAEDVHNAWAVWRSLADPTHQHLVPFDQLSAEVRELDLVYTQRVAAAAKELEA